MYVSNTSRWGGTLGSCRLCAQEQRAEESSEVVELKTRQKADQEAKLYRQAQHGGANGGGGGSGSEDDAVAQVARMHEEEAKMVAQCTGMSKLAALELVSRCGGAADAIEYHFDMAM